VTGSGDASTATVALMGTVVSVEVVGHGRTATERADRAEATRRAIQWMRDVETCCTRFDPSSELMRLCGNVGVPTPVSDTLFECVRFALAVAEASGGAFDPTASWADDGARFTDVMLDDARRTIVVGRPLVLDLGAVAKGLAVDLAARELAPFENFAIDAGGDLYLAGRNRDGEPWTVGIRHPREPDAVFETVVVSDIAVCTSGDYERGAHIVGGGRVISTTVIAPTAMVADALGTAAFVLGPIDGLAFLEGQGVDGMMVTPDLQRVATPSFERRRVPDPASRVPAIR
jgi:thiamine biosynthesis lipoprotein